jgi:succinate dehydrogenase assembly factor 1
MFRRSVLRYHNIRDSAGNAHSFAFDSSTRIYKEAVTDGKGSPGAAQSTSRSVDIGRGRRMSGLQLEILGLFRSCLKEAHRLEDQASRRNLHKFIRSEFEQHKSIPRKMVTSIEWRIHYARTKLEDLKNMKRNTKFNVMC